MRRLSHTFPYVGENGKTRTYVALGEDNGKPGQIHLSAVPQGNTSFQDRRVLPQGQVAATPAWTGADFDPLGRPDSRHIRGKILKMNALQDKSHDMNLPRPPFETTSWQGTDYLIN